MREQVCFGWNRILSPNLQVGQQVLRHLASRLQDSLILSKILENLLNHLHAFSGGGSQNQH